MASDNSTFRIAHLSDLHLTVNDSMYRTEAKLFGKLKGMNSAFRKVMQSQSIKKSDYIIVTGDVADTGKIEEWKVFWETVSSSGCNDRILVIPGNHDISCLGLRTPNPANIQKDYAKAAAGLQLGHQKSKFPCVHHLNSDIAVFSLNSNNLGNTTGLTTAVGQLAHFQLLDFAALLHVHRNVPLKIVALHHSPNIPKEETEAKRNLKKMKPIERLFHQIPQHDRRALRLLCVTHGVRLVIHGHLHREEKRRVNGVQIIGAPATTEPVDGKGYKFWTYEVSTGTGRIKYLRATVNP